MSFRRKLLGVFVLTVVLCVAGVAGIISHSARKSFEKASEQQTAALVAQFRREFARRGDEIVNRVEDIAATESVTHMALALSRGSPDYATYFDQARAIAEEQQLSFLEFVDSQGVIISSAQWPARFGYRDASVPTHSIPRQAFLQREELPDGAALGLCAVREVNLGDKSLFVIGGRRLDKDFLASLVLPAGTRVLFYQNLAGGFEPQLLIDSSGNVPQNDAIVPLIAQVQQQARETTTLVHWSTDAGDDETIDAIPLQGVDHELLGILLVGTSRRPYVELRRHIRSAGLLSAGAGIVLAILVSGWAAARVTRPVEELARAARQVAAGNWRTEVAVASPDELGELAESFNHMTRELLDQRERLVQSERVAAWRELARRLAHELKNPLFPLQLTVENLLRARQQTPEQFEEIFKESASTLLAEIANLKTIISRFSEFARMPQPQLRQVQLNDVVKSTVQLFQAQLQGEGRAAIEGKLELDTALVPAIADPELLHRALSNLVLNAMDAMPQGGTLTLRTRQEGERAYIEVSDNGVGLTPEECARLFTPYYTTKAHGTGLGLAIVQSIISDHGGTISVRSEVGQGTTFIIELPRAGAKAQAGAAGSAFGAVT